jgi:ubiquitin-protein ligase
MLKSLIKRNISNTIQTNNHYYVNNKQINLNILSSIYPNKFFEIFVENDSDQWTIPRKDTFHIILHKILKQYNLLTIPKLDKEIDKHLKNLIELVEILKIYNYCFNCGNMLDFLNDSKFMSCDNVECLNICNSSFLDDNSITSEFQKYKNSPNESVLDFIISTAYWSLESNRREIIYNPQPLYIKIMAEQNNKTLWKLLDDCITNYPIHKILPILKKHDSDQDLYNEIGEIAYAFIKFTIKSNNTMIFADTLIGSDDIYNVLKEDQITDLNVDKTADMIVDNLLKMKQYNVVHSQIIENKFKKAQNTCYLYHGSRQENWYSIMRNGLKIGSTDNKLLVNGAVHGTGIYLSDIINFSITYSNSPNIIVGVCQVIDTRDKWKKTTNIYVVPEETHVMLKYMIILPNNNTNQLFYLSKILDNKFQSGIYHDQNTKKTQVTSLRSKRLMKEYKTLMSQSQKDLGFRITLPHADNLDLWKIHISAEDFTGNDIIQNDLKKYGIEEVELEFKFNENYPVQPPFVRIVSPRFIYRTGHITLGGSICMELLTNQGWDITTSVSTVITYIKSAIIDGEGRIDPAGVNKSYTITEAQEAFDRMLKSHGWI